MAPSECRPHGTLAVTAAPAPGATWDRIRGFCRPSLPRTQRGGSPDMSGHASRRATCAMDATVAWSPAAEIDSQWHTKAIG